MTYTTSLVETFAQPSPQIEAPQRLNCECTFEKANPLGRPDSEFHQGHVDSTNEPTELKKRLSMSTINPNSKVEDTVAHLLSANN